MSSPSAASAIAPIAVLPVVGLPEIGPGDDLPTLVLEALGEALQDGDVVVVTSKVVSKAAGLVVDAARADLLDAHTDRVVARRSGTTIVRTRHGLTMAAAGIDCSNTAPGTSVPLPPDPDADARDLRRSLCAKSGRQVAVVVSDTAGRAWRTGQTDLAIGVAGLVPVLSLAGEHDSFGNTLAVTAPALADEIAAAADLVQAKTRHIPVAVVRGLPADWLTVDDGPGAAALIRAEPDDMFGYGSIEAVRAAVSRGPHASRGFPTAEPGALTEILTEALAGFDADLVVVDVSDSGPEPPAIVVRPRTSSPQAWASAGAVCERLRTLHAAMPTGATISVDVTA